MIFFIILSKSKNFFIAPSLHRFVLASGEKVRNVLFYSSSCSNGKNKELVNETEKAYGTLIAFMSASFSLNYNYESF